jgi:hypothetical protein
MEPEQEPEQLEHTHGHDLNAENNSSFSETAPAAESEQVPRRRRLNSREFALMQYQSFQGEADVILDNRW